MQPRLPGVVRWGGPGALSTGRFHEHLGLDQRPQFSGDEPGITVIKNGKKLRLDKLDRVFVSDQAIERARQAEAGADIPGVWKSINDTKFAGDAAGINVMKDGKKLPLDGNDRVFVSDGALSRATGIGGDVAASLIVDVINGGGPDLARSVRRAVDVGRRVITRR